MTPEQRAKNDIEAGERRVTDAVEEAELRGSALIATRAIHSVGAFLIVYAGCVLVGMPQENSKEVAALTAGLSWFSTEATDRISTTIKRVFNAKQP